MNKRISKKINKFILDYLYNAMEKSILIIYCKEFPNERLSWELYTDLYDLEYSYENYNLPRLKDKRFNYFIKKFYKKIIKNNKQKLISDVPKDVPECFNISNISNRKIFKYIILELRPDIPEYIRKNILSY